MTAKQWFGLFLAALGIFFVAAGCYLMWEGIHSSVSVDENKPLFWGIVAIIIGLIGIGIAHDEVK